MQLQFDSYSRKARLSPALIVLLPLAAALFVWFYDDPTLPGVLRGLTASGTAVALLSVLIAQLARSAGKRKEPKLWEDWGGAPTTRLLRHGAPGLSPVTRQRYHAAFRAWMQDVRIPTEDEERAAPKAADDVYEACVDCLRALTRDSHRFPLIAVENANYGFHRNLWALRPIGISLCITSVIVITPRLVTEWSLTKVLPVVPTLGILLSVALLMVWLLVITSEWVRVPAEAYAKQLLAACETLESSQPPSENRATWASSTS